QCRIDRNPVVPSRHAISKRRFGNLRLLILLSLRKLKSQIFKPPEPKINPELKRCIQEEVARIPLDMLPLVIMDHNKKLTKNIQ
ncbi:hypothetical protein NPIL_389311, partial [Nephila pilipes]